VRDPAAGPELVQSWEHVVGIDPGIRNAGFAFVGFDDENVATQFDEGLIAGWDAGGLRER
jgi:Holliday junction resolvasome RuvABC endonuclease subunit